MKKQVIEKKGLKTQQELRSYVHLLTQYGFRRSSRQFTCVILFRGADGTSIELSKEAGTKGRRWYHTRLSPSDYIASRTGVVALADHLAQYEQRDGIQYCEKTSLREGWLLVNNDGKLEIQRDDEAEKFASDTEALAYVVRRAKTSAYHAAMLYKHGQAKGRKAVRA